jgi:GNAT superfamily N-acetyltransferase
LIDESGEEKQILTFGPLCILPEYQREGYGKALLEYSFQKGLELGYDVIVIFGNPGNYVSRGFKSCKKYNVCVENDMFPSAMLVKELKTGILDGRKWYYKDSPLYQVDRTKVQSFDEQFEPKEKLYKPSQEEFYIHCNSVIK